MAMARQLTITAWAFLSVAVGIGVAPLTYMAEVEHGSVESG